MYVYYYLSIYKDLTEVINKFNFDVRSRQQKQLPPSQVDTVAKDM